MKEKKKNYTFIRNLKVVINEVFEGNTAELCRRSDVPRSTVESMLKGHVDPRADALSKLAKAAGTSMDLLYNGKVEFNKP